MNYACTIVGASFAGLACATTLARAGHRVLVLERKAEAGEKLHTTGLLVKEAVESSRLLADLPPVLVRRVEGVRLYAPNLRHVDLDAPGYYFLATDTGALLRWLAGRAEEAGAEIRWRTPFETSGRLGSGFTLGRLGSTQYLVGADGPVSRVARAHGLGANREFLFGVEHEYEAPGLPDAHRLHCFLDRRIAPGYLGWVVAGVGAVQVGIARRERGGAAREAKAALASFLDKIAPVFDFRGRAPLSIRAGLIPCGGVVRPAFADRVLLVGDAAGTVSPLTAGGIHTALRHGAAAGEAIGAFLEGRAPDPGARIASAYPRFRAKRLLRWAFDRFQHDGLANALLGTAAVREAASRIYFHRGAGR